MSREIRFAMIVRDGVVFNVYPPESKRKKCFKSLEEAKEEGFEFPIVIEENPKSIVYRGYYRGEPALLVALINDRRIKHVRYLAKISWELHHKGESADSEITIECLDEHDGRREKRL